MYSAILVFSLIDAFMVLPKSSVIPRIWELASASGAFLATPSASGALFSAAIASLNG